MGVISNDLELLNEIFNGTKHRAVSLRQLSFLLVGPVNCKCHRAMTIIIIIITIIISLL